MPESVLMVEKADGVATLTLNRPQAMNALSRELRLEIVSAFAAWYFLVEFVLLFL